MSIKIPAYSLVMIKPLTVGRGHAPLILEDILKRCPVNLCLFRSWEICATTWRALYPDEALASAHIETAQPGTKRSAWVCLFVHADRDKDPYLHLVETCGPDLSYQKMPNTRDLKYIYRGVNKVPHPADTVIHISNPKRVKLEALLLFKDFHEEMI